MKSLILFAFVPLLGWLGAASPIYPTKILVNRPNGDVFLPRERRSTLQQSEAELGGYPISASTLAKRLKPGEYLCGDHMVHICRMVPGVKGTSYEYVLPVSELEKRVTKGEFVCGDRICMLEAGKEPPGCHGICQYPL